MAKKAILKDTFRKNVIRDMGNLEIFKPEYEPVIGIYCEIYEQYQKLTKKYIESELEDVSIAKRLESLRKDFLTYSDRLGLNPKALDSIDGLKRIKKQSTLVLALKEAAKTG